MSPLEGVSRKVAYMDKDFAGDKIFDDGVHFGLYIAMSILKHDVDALTIERDELKNENTILKERSRERDIRICELISEVEKLKLQIEHKDEIIALHNYYNKLKTNK